MTARSTFRRVPMTILITAALLAACGGGAKKVAVTTTVVPTTLFLATTTTVAPTTTTTVAPTTTTVAPATTVVAVKTYPFTGLPVTDEKLYNRPALAIKVNNASDARPQAGLNQADIVVEEIVEGITRFMAVYQSTDVDKVGSIRSARTSDLDLLRGLGKPLFAWSGANGYVVNAVHSLSNVTDVGFDSASDLYTIGRRLQDYTEFFISTKAAYERAPEGSTAPSPLFTYRSSGAAPVGGSDIAKVELTLDGTHATWTWSAEKKAWLRSTDGRVHEDRDGVQLSPANVVVAFSNYRMSPADPHSPEVVSVGEGPAWVLTDGKLVKGTWKRDTATSPYVLTDTGGKVIALTPGRTFLELPRTEQANAEPQL